MARFQACIYLAYACRLLCVNASWSVLVTSCVPEDNAPCEPGLLIIINETLWSGQLTLSYIIEAGLHLTQIIL